MLMVSRGVGEVSVADESDWSNRATPRIALRSHVVFRRPVLQCVLHCVLQNVAACCRVLQRVAACCSTCS